MAYTYSTFVAALQRAVVLDNTNAAFLAYLPAIIDMAEQTCYSDLDLISTIVVNSAGTATPNNRLFTTPLQFVDIQGVNILNGGVRVASCTKISRSAADVLYPADIAAPGTIPNKWAPLTDMTIYLLPSPSAAFNVEIVGPIRPQNLSLSNSTTFLSSQLPALFFAAAMVQAQGYKQNFGAQADNPQMALSWAQIYKELLPSAQNEETKRKFQAFAAA